MERGVVVLGIAGWWPGLLVEDVIELRPGRAGGAILVIYRCAKARHSVYPRGWWWRKSKRGECVFYSRNSISRKVTV